MALEAGQLYAVTAAAYRTGVLDKFLSIAGDAMDGAMEETGLNLDDLLNRADEVKEETLRKGDRLLGRSAFLLRFASSDRLMNLLSRLLDRQAVKRVAASGMQRFLVKAITGSDTK
jgi:hypothetical protein